MIYHMLKYRADYQDAGDQAYETQQRERTVRNLRRRAERLGFSLTPVSAPTVS